MKQSSGKPDRREWLRILGAGCFAACLAGCRLAPDSGRKQLILMTKSQEMELGKLAYESIVSSESTTNNLPLAQLVNRVGNRLARVADRAEYAWEFQLLQGRDGGAFCLPGGKVAVYEGVLPVCENEAGLAALMSHEIAHTLARHHSERMSRLIVNQGANDLAKKMIGKQAPTRSDRVLNACGVETEWQEATAFSARQEAEADQLAVRLMSEAGYDPNEAPRLWNRIKAESGPVEEQVNQIHPGSERRVLDLLALMSDAQQRYAGADEKLGIGQVIVNRG